MFRRDVLVPVVGLLLSLVALWVLAGPRTEIERTRRHFVELQRQLVIARQGEEPRASDRDQAAVIASRRLWGDAAAVRNAVLSTPLVTLPGAPAVSDLMAVHAPNSSGCAACHLSVATMGFEDFPVPFRTHSKLGSYVGAESPHPPSRVECVSCHQGDGLATGFTAARHTTLGPLAAAEDTRTRAADAAVDPPVSPASMREWADANGNGAMLSVGRTEAACGTCHEGERYQPGAVALSDAWTTLERGGCYGCHVLPGPERTRKRGPDLTRIAGKLSPAWVRAWLANPRAIKPATWMPRFWTSDAPSDMDAAAIDAVTAYLFAISDPYAPATSSPPLGDGARGRHLIESVGCTGCHVLGDASRDATSQRRTFGPPLQGIGDKTTYGWLFDWLRDPSRYNPDARMPNLRLTVAESADVATYLASARSAVASRSAASVLESDERYRAVYREYAEEAVGRPAESRLDVQQLNQLTGIPLRMLAGRVVIERLQCSGCHAIRGFESQRAQRQLPPRSNWLDADARGIHQRRNGASTERSALAGPDLGLGPNEASRLALALTAVAGRLPSTHAMSMPWHIAKVAGRALLQERNCVACHAVDGIGGDFSALVSAPSLAPPPLTAEGYRGQLDWLRGFLREPKAGRPRLEVRMPTFALTDDEVSVIGRYLQAIAPPRPTPAGR
ncbi:MAG: c-type cytochrome [Vicinamibacterales bacterium]